MTGFHDDLLKQIAKAIGITTNDGETKQLIHFKVNLDKCFPLFESDEYLEVGQIASEKTRRTTRAPVVKGLSRGTRDSRNQEDSWSKACASLAAEEVRAQNSHKGRKMAVKSGNGE